MRRYLILAMLLAVSAGIVISGGLTSAVQGADPPADDEKKPAEEKEESPPPTLVQVDISEKVDGRVYTVHSVQFQTVFLLWHAGLDFKSERETRWDKKLETYKPRKTEDPDFIVKGEAKATLLRRPTWYEEAVAYIYGGEAEITIEDPEGNLVGRYRLSLERSDKQREDALLKTLERLGYYAASTVVDCKVIRDRIPEKRREHLEKILAEIRKEIAEFGGTLQDLTPKESGKGGADQPGEKDESPGREKDPPPSGR